MKFGTLNLIIKIAQIFRRTEGANPVLAANTYTSPTNDPATDSLTKNIYSQVGALIQQNDRAPELLARLLQDLTLLGQVKRNNRIFRNGNDISCFKCFIKFVGCKPRWK